MRWAERGLAVLAGISIVAAVSVLAARSDESKLRGSATVSLARPQPPAVQTPEALRATPAPTDAPKPLKKTPVPGAVTTTGRATLRTWYTFKAPGKTVLPAGVLASVLGAKGEFYHVFTPDERTGWLHASKVKVHEKAAHSKARSLEDATIVLDPGHGGHLPGATGKGGLTEKAINLGITRRLAGALDRARVFITRSGGHAGLAYRASLANKLGAHVFVSIHNNALPDRLSKKPGAEVYYSQRPGSKRLAGLLYEELYKILLRYKAKWGRDPFAGAKYRLSQQHGGDYYAVLRRSYVPAVIVEGMFITNPSEERLLRRPEVRQAMAEALARGLKRYFTTDDPGSGFQDPYAKPTPNCPIPGCFEHRK